MCTVLQFFKWGKILSISPLLKEIDNGREKENYHLPRPSLLPLFSKETESMNTKDQKFSEQ